MIPLHLHRTTVHIDRSQAEALVSAHLAEWLPLTVPALRSTRPSDDEVLACIA